MKSRNYFPNVGMLIKKNKSFVNVAKKKTYYKEISEVYKLISARNKHTKKEVIFLKSFLNKKCTGKKILDLACGVGRHSHELAKLGFKTVAIDQSQNMLKIARKRDSLTKYIQSDIRDFFIGTGFDAAFCLWTTYNYLSTKRDFNNFLNCVHNSLKSNGFLILESRNFFKKSDKLEFRRRIHENSQYRVELFIRKYINLIKKVQDAVYIYLITDKKTSKTYSSIDTELVKIYSKKDIQNLIKGKFKIYKTLGDYDLDFSYNRKSSDRLIFILQKLDN